jgi:hypothetical protein
MIPYAFLQQNSAEAPAASQSCQTRTQQRLGVTCYTVTRHSL